MLKPLPETSNTDKMAKLGRLYSLREARRDAATQLQRACMTLLNQPDLEIGPRETLVQEAREALDRLQALNDMEEIQ
jgi:hypothetical protein